jgi:quercetin dioxygenase-like cupin family protein
MTKAYCLLFGYLLCCMSIETRAQKLVTTVAAHDSVAITQELKAFFNSYADDLRNSHRAEIANRYDARGYYRVGNGLKTMVSFEDSKNRYLNRWTGPKGFEWKDLSFEVLSDASAIVTGLFEWKVGPGDSVISSYTALLVKNAGEWRIRLEDESISPVGYTTQAISGKPTEGVFKYRLTASPASSISAHRHSEDMHIIVRSGRKFMLMGDLNTAKVQVFEAGSTILIPAGTWHVEWWETVTVEEIEIKAPWKTERATPSTPRKE